MLSTTLLQIFLLIEVFIMGILATLAAHYAYAHFKPEKHESKETERAHTDNQLPAKVKEQLLKSSEAEFQTMINKSITHLQNNLEDTTEQINNLIKRLAAEVVNSELTHYKENLTKLHSQAEKDLSNIKQEVDSYQSEVRAKVNQELEAEKQRLIKQIDTKLSDAVGSFLLETLGHNVDLGSQTDYLVAELEKHKSEFMQEVSNET